MIDLDTCGDRVAFFGSHLGFRTWRAAVFAIASVWIAAQATAAPVVIDFETLRSGDPINASNQPYVGVFIEGFNAANPSLGVRGLPAAIGAAILDTDPGGQPLTGTDIFGSLVVQFFSTSTRVRVTFDEPVVSFSVDFLDGADDEDTLTLLAFDENGQLIVGTAGLLPDGVTNAYDRLSVASSPSQPIHSVEFWGAGAFGASQFVDNLVYEPLVGPAIPTASTWAHVVVAGAMAGAAVLRLIGDRG